MINAGSVVAFMELDTSKFSSGLGTARQQLHQFMDSNNSMQTRMQGLGNSMQTVGKTATLGVTLPLAGMGAAIVKTSMDFESGMSKVSAISGATGGDLEKLKSKAMEMGSKTKFSATEASNAFSYMAMAGWKTNEMMSGIDGIMNLAAASGEDLASTSDIVTDALTAFGLKAKDSGHFADVLAAASSNANTNVSMLGESFKYVAPVAGSLGYSAEDTSIALGLMANNGIKASQAGTSLRASLTNMVKPTKKMKGIMDQYGISLTDGNGKMKSLKQVMDELREKMGGLDKSTQAAAAATLFGKESMSGMLAIINASPQDYDKLTNAIYKADGTSKKMSDTMNDNLKGQLTILKSTIESVSLQLGETLVPTIKLAVKGLQSFASWFGSLNAGTKRTIVNLGLLAAAFGPVMMIAGKIISSTSLVFSTFGKVGSIITSIGKLGGAIKGLGGVFSKIRSAASVFTVLPGLISPPILITIGIIAGLGLIAYEVVKHWDKVGPFFVGVGKTIRGAFATVSSYLNKSKEGWHMQFQQFGDYLTKSGKGWHMLFDELGDAVTKKMNEWKTMGSHIIDGLAAGLKAGKDKVVNGIKNIGSSLMGAFTGKLGINSPSRVFAEYGGFIGQGLLGGMQSMESSLVKQTSKYSEIIKPKLPQTQMPKVALGGIGSGNVSTKGLMNKLKDSVLNFNPKITLYVTVADTGEKGTAKLSGEVKTMTGNALKNAMTDLFMNDVLRD